jgi:fatty-acyl-CoA synthase
LFRICCHLTFSEVDDRASRLVSYFARAGLESGDRLALLSKNEIEFLEIQVAATRAGLILVPLNFRLTEPELEYILGDCDPSLLIAAREFEATAKKLANETLVLGDEYENALADASSDSDAGPILADRDCKIIYTSGTTGRPKGAVISNSAMFARISNFVFEYETRPGDVFLQCLPLFHIASSVTFTYAYAGATNVFLKDFHPLGVLESIEK